ncbi:MAG: nitroreductase [Verrucomicrobia bacterium]|nr:nitroreductase [Verrucomicrobiota bacterium]MDA1086771.1 nitroreductase [Verrucomicrobiota bacterium]
MTSLRELIRSRRSTFDFNPGPVPLDDVRELFEAGIWAPNHKLTQPWRFIHLGEQTRSVLRLRYAELQKQKGPDMSEAAQQERYAKGMQKFDSKPTIVAVSCSQEGSEIQKREDYAATCCAMQNVALAAWDAGVGMQWSTGPMTREAATYELLDIDTNREYIIGFFYMGYPCKTSRTRRKSIDEVFRTTE